MEPEKYSQRPLIQLHRRKEKRVRTVRMEKSPATIAVEQVKQLQEISARCVMEQEPLIVQFVMGLELSRQNQNIQRKKRLKRRGIRCFVLTAMA